MNGRRLWRPSTSRMAKARRPSRSAQRPFDSEQLDTLCRLRGGLATFPDQGINDVVVEVDAHIDTDRDGQAAAEDQRREAVERQIHKRGDRETAGEVHLHAPGL